jgi:hypothetical protein
MISLKIVFVILIVHWIADFIFQDEKWALSKSKNWKDLLNHTATYSVFWFLVGIFVGLNLVNSIAFMLITFVAHTITDYFTSRIVSKKFANKEYGSPIPNLGGFTIIGFDQLLHYTQLLLTYWYLTS